MTSAQCRRGRQAPTPRRLVRFDLHTDAMMAFTAEIQSCKGKSDGNGSSFSSDVDRSRAAAWTTINVVHAREGALHGDPRPVLPFR